MDSVAQQLIARLQLTPSDEEAYRALKAHYSQQNDLASLINLLIGRGNHSAQTGGAETDLEAAQAFLEAASLLSGAMQQPEHAEKYYRLALELAPNTEVALQRLLDTLGNAAPPQYVTDALTKQLHDVRASADGAAEKYIEEAQAKAMDAGDCSAGIDSLRTALRAMPGDIQVMYELATLLLRRANGTDGPEPPPGEQQLDLKRAAELLYQIGQGLSETPTEAIPYLQSALGAVPAHDGALSLLEQLAPTCGMGDTLAQYWVAYLAQSGPGPASDQRRVSLGRAYATAGQVDDAIFCLSQLPENHAEAAALLSSLHGRDQDMGGSAAELPSETRLGKTRPPRARTASESRRADDAEQVEALRKEVHRLVANGDQETAATHCLSIIRINATDPEAFYFLESHYRRERAFSQLRDLLLMSTRLPGVPVDTRRDRLVEVAALSEQKLRDLDTAIAALQGVVALSAADPDSTNHLKRLLAQAARWDELVDVVEREALSATTIQSKTALLRKLAEIHKNHRHDDEQTLDALRQVYDLQPDQADVDQACAWPELSRELRHQAKFGELASLLEDRVAVCADPAQKVVHLKTLLSVAEQDLSDEQLAYETSLQLREFSPGETLALEVAERIERAREDFIALAQTLRLQAEARPPAERPEAFTALGQLYLDPLGQNNEAADAFSKALELQPNNAPALDGLIASHEQSGTYVELADLLQKRATSLTDSAAKVDCYKRLAIVYEEQLLDSSAAAAAYEALLKLEENESALHFLYAYAEGNCDHDAEAAYLTRLLGVATNLDQKQSLLFDLALLQRDKMNSPQEALNTLKSLITETGQCPLPAADALQELARELGDRHGEAISSRCTLEQSMPDSTRAADAKRLFELAEAIEDTVLAGWALDYWCACEPSSQTPHRHLVKLHRSSENWENLQQAWEALASLEADPCAREQATLCAADVAAQQRGEPKEAWALLQPLVEAGHSEAELALLLVCRHEGWLEQLVNLHIAAAQNDETPQRQRHHFLRATQLLRIELKAPSRALQAASRALAIDLQSHDALEQVEQLCVETRDWDRLNQVYERIVASVPPPTGRPLLLRHAGVLEAERAQPARAFSLLSRAIHLAPDDLAPLDRAEVLAAGHRGLPFLELLEDLSNSEQGESVQASILARAANFAEHHLADREGALKYLGRMVLLSETVPELVENAVSIAQSFDEEQQHLEPRPTTSAVRALAFGLRQIAEQAVPNFASSLYLRAGELLAVHEEQPRAALALLLPAIAQLPDDNTIYDATLRLAEQLDRVPALERELSRLAREAMDAQAAIGLLKRQADLLRGQLANPKGAAKICGKIVQLHPRDLDLAKTWRQALRDADMHQDLLVAIGTRLGQSPPHDETTTLLREVAQIWDTQLDSRFEAQEAWRRLLAQEPEDAEAKRALERLGRERRAPKPTAPSSTDPSDGTPPEAAR